MLCSISLHFRWHKDIFQYVCVNIRVLTYVKGFEGTYFSPQDIYELDRVHPFLSTIIDLPIMCQIPLVRD